ncbi:MAG: DUF2891 domain-containing protein [Caldilineaceae bacterium]
MSELAQLASVVEQFIPITLANLQREYPNGLLHQLKSDADVQPPRVLHPIFYSCYDWHSAVHSYWQVVRALRLFPDGAFAPAAVTALDQAFAPENVAGEMAYLQDRPGFELPYGMAWLLQLTAELREMATPLSLHWLAMLQPLEQHAAQRLMVYFKRMPHPIRTGLHNQTAFALGLTIDWAQISNEQITLLSLHEATLRFFAADQAAPLAYEPSAVDFLSPALAEADVMRRVLNQTEFVHWLTQFFGANMVETLPQRLPPVQMVDASEGQLAHFAGLNLSRAWMLEGIHRALPAADQRRPMLADLAQRHRAVGLVDAFHPDYMVSHWAPSFALYLLTARGLR